jgi:hypothetical protein
VKVKLVFISSNRGTIKRLIIWDIAVYLLVKKSETMRREGIQWAQQRD